MLQKFFSIEFQVNSHGGTRYLCLFICEGGQEELVHILHFRVQPCLHVHQPMSQKSISLRVLFPLGSDFQWRRRSASIIYILCLPILTWPFFTQSGLAIYDSVEFCRIIHCNHNIYFYCYWTYTYLYSFIAVNLASYSELLCEIMCNFHIWKLKGKKITLGPIHTFPNHYRVTAYSCPTTVYIFQFFF